MRVATVERVSTRGSARERTSVKPGALLGLAVALATLVGLIVRVLPAWTSDFPLNDGGMFLLMADEVRRNDYALPGATAYNGAAIPFAYPPLGFYLAALLADATGAPLHDVVRLLPSLLALLTIPAFALLAGAVVRPRLQVIAAIFAFALLPRSFAWLIMGGGLTRAAGALFAILTLWQAYLLYTRGDRHHVALAALFGGLTVLSHAEWAWFTAYSAALFLLFLGRNRRGLVNSLLVAAGVATLSAPWWAAVIARHGPAPILAAAQSGSGAGNAWRTLLTFDFTAEPFLPVLGVIGLLGLFACLAGRAFLVPAWLLVILIVQPRSSATLATLPLALLVGVALDRVVLPGLGGLVATLPGARGRADVTSAASENPPALPSSVPRAFLAYCLFYALLGAVAVPSTSPSLRALSPDERAAMAWVATNTDQGSRFLVLTPTGATGAWWEDRASEWFPVLAARTSLGTVQGSEWLPDGAFLWQAERTKTLHACASANSACLEGWARGGNVTFTHVFIAKERQPLGRTTVGCCDPLVHSLSAANDYTLVFDGPGAAIFARSAAVDGGMMPHPYRREDGASHAASK